MLVDSHCHLEFPDFAPEQDAVIQRARAAGVGHFLTISTRVHRFDEIASIAEAHDDISCSLGTHPHSAEEEADITTARLAELGRHPKVVAIGETGLDYYYDNSSRELQQEAFRRHIRAALELGLPVIVHTRDAEDDTMRILREEGQGAGLTGVLHCFSSSPQLAEDAVDFGFHISFSGILTFKNAEDLRSCAREFPLDRLMVETDSPYLAPIPHRGRKCEPGMVRFTAQKLAEVKGISFEEVARATTVNSRKVFNLPAPGRRG